MSRPVLCSAIQLPDSAAPPEWLHLLPAGEVRTVDGRGPYRIADPAALVAASVAAGKLPLDENHSTDRAAPRGEPAPARGWITTLEARDDGIWGRVEWTAEALRTSLHQAYRGVSPAIFHQPDGTITAIARASLTNTPNLAGLVALHNQGTHMDFRAWLIEALGLAADADDAAIKAALSAKLKGGDTAVALQSALAPIAAAAGVAADADAQVVLAGVQRLKAGATDSAAVLSLQSELATAVEQLNALTDANARRDAEAFVDGAIAAGRVGVKAMRDEYISLHMEDRSRAEKLVGAMPVLKTGATLSGDVRKSKDGLGEANHQVIALMGIDPAAYAAALAAEGSALA